MIPPQGPNHDPISNKEAASEADLHTLWVELSQRTQPETSAWHIANDYEIIVLSKPDNSPHARSGHPSLHNSTRGTYVSALWFTLDPETGVIKAEALRITRKTARTTVNYLPPRPYSDKDWDTLLAQAQGKAEPGPHSPALQEEKIVVAALSNIVYGSIKDTLPIDRCQALLEITKNWPKD